MWMDSDEQGGLSAARDRVSAHKGVLKWVDRAYQYTPDKAKEIALLAAKKAGYFDIDEATDPAVGNLETLMPRLESAVAGLKAGINPGPFRYAFERSDPTALLRYAVFLLYATDEDWQGLIQTLAPVRSAPTIVKNVRAEFRRLAMYPAAGWLAGTAMGCALPLNVPIVTLVMAYNLVGASLAYAKGIDDLDRELASAMPNIHEALGRRIDATLQRSVPAIADRLRKS